MISVIIPTYNHANELRQCLASIKAQTFKDIEVVVVDDGSVDNPQLVVAELLPQAIFLRQENQGAAAARNRGFEQSQGEYVIFVDADVVMKPTMLEKMHQVLAEQPDISFVYSAFYIGKKRMKYIPFTPEKLKQFNYIHTTSLLRRNDFPGFDESLGKFQDWDLWLTLLEQGKKGAGIDEPLFKIINPGKGTMSVWLPKFVYKLPWPIFGFTPKVLQKYFSAREIIKRKHNL